MLTFNSIDVETASDDRASICQIGKIAVVSACAALMLATSLPAAAITFKNGHELLEAADAYMDSASGDAKRITANTVYLSSHFSDYVSGFYDGHSYASLWHGRRTCVPPEGSIVGAVYGGLLGAVHRFLSHGAVYGLETMTIRTSLALRGHFGDTIEALSPKEFLDLPPSLLVFLGMEAFCADISPLAPES